MRRNKGFTLIEVMVVLSILAIIAILAYNFFGSTMKEATLKQQVTKLYNDLRTFDDAAALYFTKNGSHPANIDALVSAGIIKAIPAPPSSLAAIPYDHLATYAKYPDNNDAGDTSESDRAFSLEVGAGISDELCSAFNEYVGLPAEPYDNSATEIYPAIYSCVTWDADPNSGNVIVAFYSLD